jgi:hypothetical protein
MFPNCLEVEDMVIMSKREQDLDTIRIFSAQAFLGVYATCFLGHFLFRMGSAPYMKDCVKHGILAIAGTSASFKLSEKVAAETYYN